MGSVSADMPHGEPELFKGSFSKLWWQIDGFIVLADRGEKALVVLSDMASSALQFINDYEVAVGNVIQLGQQPQTVIPPAWLEWSNSLDDQARADIGLFWTTAMETAGIAIFVSVLALLAKRELELKQNPTADDLAKIADYKAALVIMKEQLASLATLTDWATSDQGAVDRHLAGVIEALTARVDAWATSLATARLRSQCRAPHHPPGCVWAPTVGSLMSSQPRPRRARPTPDGFSHRRCTTRPPPRCCTQVGPHIRIPMPSRLTSLRSACAGHRRHCRCAGRPDTGGAAGLPAGTGPA